MNKVYFQDAEDALIECDALTEDDILDSEDRATISAFYNGRQTMSECEAEDKGINELTNHLFGYDSIKTADDQIFSTYSKSPTVWRIQVKNAPDGLDQRWSEKATKFLNEAIKKSKRLKPEFKSFSGEVTLYGSFHFCYYDNYDWCPRARRPLAPRGSSTIPEDIDYLVIREDLRLKDLYAYLRRTERLDEQGLKSGWKASALRRAIKAIEGTFDNAGQEREDAQTSSHSGPTAEERENDFQINTSDTERQRLTLPVYFLYTSRPDEEGTPFDLTILARFPLDVRESATKNSFTLETMLFDKQRYFSAAKDFIHSFFIDCDIGGRTSYHRSMGLGRLNFDSDVDIEIFFNEAMQGSKENLRRLFTVSNAADTETVNRWLSGDRYSNIVPEGVGIAEQAKQPNFQHAFAVIDMLDNLVKGNANSSISNGRGQRATDELEVQAIQREGRSANAVANKMNDINDSLDTMGETVVERFLNDGILPVDKGYDEIKFFQDKMKDEVIPLSFLRQKKNGRFVNIEVKVNRVAGDGNQMREAMVNASLMKRLHLFTPSAQQDILRMVTASETQNYDLAEDLVPRDQKLDGGQINVANNENQSCLHRGITGYVPDLNRDDIHLIHLPEHMGGLEALLAKGEISGWDEMDMGGFQSIMQHIGLHLRQISANPDNKDIATAITQQLQGLMRRAGEFANNLQAKREAEAQAIPPEKLLDAQLKGAQLEQRKIEHDDLVGHRSDAMDLSRQKAGMNSGLTLRQQNIQIDEGDRKALMTREKQASDKESEILQMQQDAAQRNSNDSERAPT